jgi:hypothetical protein
VFPPVGVVVPPVGGTPPVTVVEPPGAVLPPGAVVFPPGAVLPPGAVVLPPGAVVFPPGAVVIPPVSPPGSDVVPPGSDVLPPGSDVAPPGAVVVPPGAIVVPPLTLPAAPVAPPELIDPALEPEPPVAELQPWSNGMVPARSKAAEPRTRANVAFRVLVRIATSMMSSVLRIVERCAIRISNSGVPSHQPAGSRKPGVARSHPPRHSLWSCHRSHFRPLPLCPLDSSSLRWSQTPQWMSRSPAARGWLPARPSSLASGARPKKHGSNTSDRCSSTAVPPEMHEPKWTRRDTARVKDAFSHRRNPGQRVAPTLAY